MLCEQMSGVVRFSCGFFTAMAGGIRALISSFVVEKMSGKDECPKQDFTPVLYIRSARASYNLTQLAIYRLFLIIAEENFPVWYRVNL